jgi:hypothetical protein
MSLSTPDDAAAGKTSAEAPPNEVWQFSLSHLLLSVLLVACVLVILRLCDWQGSELVALLAILVGCLGWLARTSDLAVRGVILVGFVACAPFFLPALLDGLWMRHWLELIALYLVAGSTTALFLAGLTALLRGYWFGGACVALSIAAVCVIAGSVRAID